MSTLAQVLLWTHLSELKLNGTHEYAFCEGRKWRFDIACLKERLAFEIEGGAWTKGRHTRGKGFIADMEKYNTATMMGWRVLRCTPEQVLSGEFKEWLKQWLSK